MLKDFHPEQQRADRVVAALKQVFDQVGRSMAQVALAWLRYRAVPVIPILGARKLSQLQDNLASFDLALSPDQIKILDDASHIDLGFPQELYAKEFPRGLRYGGMRDQTLVCLNLWSPAACCRSFLLGRLLDQFFVSLVCGVQVLGGV